MFVDRILNRLKSQVCHTVAPDAWPSHEDAAIEGSIKRLEKSLRAALRKRFAVV